MTGGLDGAGVEESPEKLLVETWWWEKPWRGMPLRRDEDRHSKPAKKTRPGQ